MSVALKPASWLRKFNSVGGYAVIGDKTFRVILEHAATTTSQQREAREMSRAFEDAATRAIITQHLCDMTLSEFHDAQRLPVKDGQ